MFLALALVLTAAAPAGPPAPRAPCTPDETDVLVELADGSLLAGTVALAELELATAFGSATVRFAEVRTLEPGPPAVVVTRDGTVLAGELSVRRLGLRAGGRRRSLELEELARLSVVERAPVVPGEVTGGRAASGSTYWLRVPDGYDPDEPPPALVILHGSNQTARKYVANAAQNWPELAADFVLVGIDGELLSPKATPDDPRFNYAYADWVGERSTLPATREPASPPAIVSTVDELRASVPVTRVFLGGHSQGAFVAYAVAMHYPERFAGVLPAAGGMIAQAEPAAFADPEVTAAQRALAFAVVHAENDANVSIAAAERAVDALEDAGFPALCFFRDATAGHAFAALPIEEAVRWLEEVTTDDVDALCELGHERARAGRWRDASALALRARALAGSAPRGALARLVERVEAQAGAAAGPLLERMRGEGDGAWIEDFLAFRADFGPTDAARPLLELHGRLRAEHDAPAEELYRAALADLEAGRPEDARVELRRIVEQYYASRRYRDAARRLAAAGG